MKEINILIAEDNLLSAMFLKEVLEPNNVEVKIVMDGESAYHESISKNYDIIFMDYHMPKMNGIESSRKIKLELDKLNKPTPLIIPCVGSDNLNEKKAWTEIGINEILMKPVSVNHLEEILTIKGFKDALKSDVSISSGATENQEKLYSLDKIIGMSRGDNRFVAKMIKIFIENIPIAIKDIESMISKNDFQKVASIIHRIKPSIKTLSLNTIIDDIQKIEDLCKQNQQLESIESLFKPVKKTCAIVIKQIKSESIYLNNN